MGFGLLFIGYFVATFMTLNTFGVYVRVLGYALILVSALRLRQYHRAFNWMGLGTLLMLVFSTILACSEISELFYQMLWVDQPLFPSASEVIFGYIEQVVFLIFQVLMLYSIRGIAKETEDSKIANRAVRNLVFICLYYTVYLLRLLPVASVQACAAELTWIAWVVYLACQVLNVLLIGSCYMRICDESDLEMERKPSRFAFVNRFRAENERRKEKARREYAEYRKEKLERKGKR